MSSISIVSDIPRGTLFAIIINDGSSMKAFPFTKWAKSWTADFEKDNNVKLPDFSSKSGFVNAEPAVIQAIEAIAGENGIIDANDDELRFILSPFSGRSYKSMKRMFFIDGEKQQEGSSDKEKEEAMKVAKIIGCRGVHKDENGRWMPCSTNAVLMRISNEAESDSFLKKKSIDPFAEPSKPRKRVRKKRRMRKTTSDGWENLRLRGVVGIDRISSGIVSAPVGKSARFGPEYVRDNDPDVFTDPESARARSRQLGCIGISRRVSKTGKTVWMPCTNMSDYARVAGTTSLGRRRNVASRQSEIRRIVRQELDSIKKKK